MKGTDRCPLEFAEKASHCVVGGLFVLGGGMCSASQCRKAATQSGKTVIYIVIIRRISANLINFGVEISSAGFPSRRCALDGESSSVRSSAA